MLIPRSLTRRSLFLLPASAAVRGDEIGVKNFFEKVLDIRHVNIYTSSPMSNKQAKPDARRDAFRAALEKLWPVAKGSVTWTRKSCGKPKTCKKCLSGEKHPSLIFTYRKDGRLHCRNVRPGQEATMRKAIENGRALERLLVEQGEELLRSLRD